MYESPLLVIVTSIILIIGALVAIPLMNRRRYGSSRSRGGKPANRAVTRRQKQAGTSPDQH
jgi:hypothetical protein